VSGFDQVGRHWTAHDAQSQERYTHDFKLLDPTYPDYIRGRAPRSSNRWKIRLK
jgi:hypothetical protein